MNEKTERLVPFALFVIAPLLVFPREMIRGGMMDGGDDKLSNLPLLLHSARKLLAGEILWTTDLWMGMPLLAEPEAATFYLPKLLLLTLSPVAAYAVYLLLHYVGAELSSYAYLRTLGLSRGASSFGAIAYGFSGFMLGHAGHTMYVVAGAWAPLFLLFLHRANEGTGRAWVNALGAALAFAACFFGGAVQLSVYLLTMAAILHGVLAWTTRSKRPLAVLIALSIPAVMLACAQLVPSLDHARSLEGGVRQDYAFATQLSWHPLLFPSLFLPLTPAGAPELYSRIGTMVSCVACVALFGSSRSRPIVRAWSAIALLSLLLIMGRWVPPLARALHALPFVDVLRGPVRHNFELGLAVAVLGAFGADALVEAPPRGDRRAVGAIVAVAAVVVAILWPTATGKLKFEQAYVFFSLSSRGLRAMVLQALLAAAAFLLVRRLARKLPELVAPALVAVALLETSAAERSEMETFYRDFTRPGVSGEFALPAGHARVVPPHIEDASHLTFPGNAALYVPGVQNLTGYASIAPRDAAVMLDLDMHGHARHREDLLFSRLPSVFGVTHAIFPITSCGTETFSLDPDAAIGAPCARGGLGDPFVLSNSKRQCTFELGEGRRRHRVEAEVRTLAPRSKPVVLGVWGPQETKKSAQIVIPPGDLGTDLRAFGGFVDLSTFPSSGWLAAYTDDPTGAEVKNLRLMSETLRTIAVLGPGAPNELTSGAVDDGRALVLPSGAHAAANLRWPPHASSATLFRLEAVARSTSGAPLLVADVFGGSTFDPESAQLTLDEHDLSRRFAFFATDFALTAFPAASLRAFVEKGGTAEVARVRLLAEHPSTVGTLRAKEPLRGLELRVQGDVVRLGPGGGAMMRVHLPVRPVVIEADVTAPKGASFALGLAAHEHGFSDSNELVASGQALEGRSRHRRAVFLPADAARAVLRTHSAGNVTVHSVVARDGCADAGWEPVKPLEAGLFLHRNTNALPRAFTVGSVVRVPSIEAARDVLRASPAFDPRDSAVVETSAPVPADLRRGRVEDPVFGGQSFQAWVESESGPTLLVMNERWDAAVRATVDGVPTELLRVNGLVRGVVVPPGRHRVEVRYVAPTSVLVGAAIALLGLLAAVLVAPRVLARLPGV